VALKDNVFKFGEVQAAIICNLDAGLFLPKDWEGTVKEGFLKSIEARAATFWNSVWIAMQFFKPRYQREVAKRCLEASRFSHHPLIEATIKALPEGYAETRKTLKLEFTAHFITQKLRGTDPKDLEQKAIKAAEKAIDDNTFEGCPLTVLFTLPDIGEEKAKQIVLDVLEIHP